VIALVEGLSTGPALPWGQVGGSWAKGDGGTPLDRANLPRTRDAIQALDSRERVPTRHDTIAPNRHSSWESSVVDRRRRALDDRPLRPMGAEGLLKALAKPSRSGSASAGRDVNAPPATTEPS
jgi:hypothetical protein